jgi:hypothetical protein
MEWGVGGELSARRVAPPCPSISYTYNSAKGYELHGEGTGEKRWTDAGFGDLKSPGEVQIALLLAETPKASIHK